MIEGQRQKQRQRYQYLRERGLCPRCGGRRDDGWIHCSSCREKERVANRKTPNEMKRGYVRKYREKCRKDGRCWICGAWLGSGRYKRCQKCRDKDNKGHEEARTRLALSVRGREE